MKAWFSQLQPKDRRTLVIGAVISVFLLSYLLVWQPASEHLQALRQAVKEDRALLQWMQQSAQQVTQLRAVAAPGAVNIADGQSLLAVIDQSAKSGNLGGAMKRVEPEGQNTVRVWFEQAHFNDVLLWLDSLQRSYGVRVANIVVERQDTPGLINARVSLEGASG